MVPVRWVLLVVIAAAVVAGCGGSDGADRATVSAPPKSADAATSRVVEPPPSGHPASFFTGPAGASNPLPAVGKAWFGTHTLCYPDPRACTYQQHLDLTHSREAAIGRQFSVIADFQQSRCSLDMGRAHAFRAEGPLVLSWEPNPHKPDQVLAGQADSCIRAVAGQLATITTGNPVILRMYHEWNGTWMSWSTNSNGTRITATQARDVFRRTVDQLRAGGAFANGKVATMLDWHEGYFGNGDAFDEIAAYPGDAYVDWIGSTGYSYGTTDQRCGGTTQHYCELSEVLHHGQCLTPPFPEQQQPGFSCNASRVPVGTEVFARNRKPYLLSETGRAENAISLQRSWMRYAGAYSSANMPGLYGVTYFDVNAQAFGEPHNWSLSTNTAKLQGFGDWGAMPRFTETAPNPNEPSPIAGLGYTKVLDESFDTLNRALWDDQIWYHPDALQPQPGAQPVDSNGILHVKSFASQGFHPTTITTRNSGRTFTPGYFEARMRWTAAEPTVAPPFAITPSSDTERRPSREAGLEAR